MFAGRVRQSPRGITPALIGIGVVGLVILAINVMYNYWLFNDKSTHA